MLSVLLLDRDESRRDAIARRLLDELLVVDEAATPHSARHALELGCGAAVIVVEASQLEALFGGLSPRRVGSARVVALEEGERRDHPGAELCLPARLGPDLIARVVARLARGADCPRVRTAT